MAITLSLTGHTDPGAHRLSRADARDWLGRAAVWFEEAGDTVLEALVVRDADEKPVLVVTSHPAVPPAEIRLGAGGRLRVTARTSPAGPGYHAHLCGLLHQFAAEFRVAWVADDTDDPTGFFAPADHRSCERAFDAWLGSACRQALTLPCPVAVGLPERHGFPDPGPVLTPLGPRPRAWLQTTAADPASARDFFPWWGPGTDAAFYRNRAVCRLWSDFPWRPPLTEAEGETTDQIANDLATAYKLDPAGDLPWREWLEVLDAIDGDEEGHTVTPADEELRERVAQRAFEVGGDGPVIGYRRGPVRATVGNGWTLVIPGDFAREWGEDRTWTGWNTTRTVWFHAVGYTKPDGTRPTPAEAVAVGRRSLPDGESVPGVDRPGLRGEAVFGETTDEDERRVWRLSGVTAADGQLVVCHVYTEKPADRDWAVETWHSLRHDG
ncbi:MAG TPA: hypothetical protein VH092_36155 [Urbifossiella sp.]|jgi:hypothetical protein|nr:hypothetical protein [Urbifossiella sp.]